MCSHRSESSLLRQGPGSCREPSFQEQYKILRAIGHGDFGQVHLARHRCTKAVVAVKVLKMVVENIPVLSEPEILKRLEHPNIIRLIQVQRSEENLYMVLECPRGEQLRQRIPPGGMQQEEALQVFRQVVCGVGYCHEQGVAHRDLRPENIVVDASGHVKIINFGYGAKFRAGEKLNNFWGTLEYLAPEIVLRQPYEGPPADTWSLGVLLYVMLAGRHPFWGSTAQEIQWCIVQAKYHVPSSVPREARRLIHRILIVNPTKRPTPNKILQHRWLLQGEPCAPHPASEALPTRSESTVLITLFKSGFDPYETWLSLTQKNFDVAMATYLLLKHPQGQGVEDAFQGWPVPQARPEDHAKDPVLPGRSASRPALHTCPVPSEYQLPMEAQQPGHRTIRGGILPAIPLRCRPAGAPALCTFSQTDSGFPMSDTSTNISGWSTTDSSSRASSQDTTPEPGHTNGWKWVRGRMAACVPALCGSVPRGSNRVPKRQKRYLPGP